VASTRADVPLCVCPFEGSGRDRLGPSFGHSHHEGGSVSSSASSIPQIDPQTLGDCVVR
jgi:hypothetical protein